MTLFDRAVLEIDLDSDTTGVFVLQIDLEDSEEITKSFVMGERGQYLQEIYDQIEDVLGDDDDPGLGRRRTGYHIDGGAGSHQWQLSFQSGLNGEQWGDGSSDPKDPQDATVYDATGSHPLLQKQVLAYYVGQARTDSSGQARLHIGMWTDGSYSDEAGEFDEPLTVAINSVSLTRGEDDTTSFEGTLELTRSADFPDSIGSTAEDAIDYILDR